MQDQLPALTPLQFVILGALRQGDQPGRAVRDELQRLGIRRTSAAFYQVMARLEAGRLIEGWYDQVVVGDQAVTERRYRLRPAGERLWQATREFYVRAGKPSARLSDV